MNQITSRLDEKSISDILRKNIWFVYLLLLDILIRVPRTMGLLGADSFTLLAFGSILSDGYFDFYFLSPFSIFGLYSYGSYPIGVPLIISTLINVGLSYEIIVLVLSMTCGIIGLVGAYYLGKQLFTDSKYVILFTAFYNLSHVFYRFTFFTITARGPFLAVLPWFLFFGVKFLRDRTYKWGILTSVSLLLSSFLHGLTVFLALYLGVVIVYFFVQYGSGLRYLGYLRERFLNFPQGSISSLLGRVSSWTVFILLLLGSYLIGIGIFDIDMDKVSVIFLSNDTIIGLTLNLIVDYGLRFGVLSIFFPIGVISTFSKDQRSSIRFAHITLICILMVTLPKTLYASILFLPAFGYYSIVGIRAVREKVSILWLGGLMSGFVLLYAFLYNSFIVSLPTWVLILAVCPLVLFCVSLVNVILKREFSLTGMRSHFRWGTHIVILSIIIFSLATTEGLNLQGDYNSLSEDEKQIIEYLQVPENTGLTFVFSSLVKVHIAAYRIPTVPMSDGISSLYYGLVNSSEIIANSHFNILELIRSGKLYHYDGEMPAYSVYNALFGLDLTIESDYEFAVSLGLQYVIVEKDNLGYSGEYRLDTQTIPCQLLNTAPNVCELVLETDSMSLFQLYP